MNNCRFEDSSHHQVKYRLSSFYYTLWKEYLVGMLLPSIQDLSRKFKHETEEKIGGRRSLTGHVKHWVIEPVKQKEFEYLCRYDLEISDQDSAILFGVFRNESTTIYLERFDVVEVGPICATVYNSESQRGQRCLAAIKACASTSR